MAPLNESDREWIRREYDRLRKDTMMRLGINWDDDDAVAKMAKIKADAEEEYDRKVWREKMAMQQRENRKTAIIGTIIRWLLGFLAGAALTIWQWIKSHHQ